MLQKPENTGAAIAAMLTAAAMIAHQVAGKATRDALFLSTFEVTSLPYVIAGSAAFSFAMVFVFSRLLSRLGPARAIPAAFAASALLLFAEWALLSGSPELVSVLFYLHMTGLGGVLISGFWSVVNERFDPRMAKRQIGRIAGGATLGGLIGGVLAERIGGVFSIGAMLPVLAVLHLFCGAIVRGIDFGAPAAPIAAREGEQGDEAQPDRSAWQILSEAPYLRNLAIVVLLASVSSVTLDYVFKAHAAESLGRGQNLMRFFAIFYTAVALGTFFIQTTLSRRFLERLGLARTVSSLPFTVMAGGMGAMVFPGLPSAAIARGLSSAANDSLFRSGYEILYTPIPPKEKRATKSLVDVGVDRLGDLVAGGVIRLILLFGAASAVSYILGLTILLAVVGLWFTRELNRGYIASLESGLKERALDLELADVRDSTTRGVISRSALPDTGLAPVAAASPAATAAYREEQTSARAARASEVEEKLPRLAANDAVIRQIAALRSGDAQKVRRVLRQAGQLDAALVPHVILLLAWDDMAPDAVAALGQIAPRIAGQLLDALLDQEQSFAVRRRIPRILARCPSRRAIEGLFEALNDKRFEVRYQCGCALESISRQNPELQIALDPVFLAVQREAAAGRKVWISQQLLDRVEERDDSPFVDDVLRQRATRSIEHVFRLLSLVLPKEPLHIAYRGLHTEDEHLRGIALEYLEIVLPPAVREALWPYLEDRRPPEREPRTPEEVLATLVRSHDSIRLGLAALREKLSPAQNPNAP
jgi:ATP/ADP translocase